MWYVNMLFLVEFADWNGERIGRGCSASNSKENNGRTDAMKYHTGTTAANRDTYGFTQYRNIEGWWDNVYDWMDGCYYNGNGLNVIKNPNQFSDSANGVLVGKPVAGYPKDFAIPTQSGLEWALYPSEAGGSTTTYVRITGISTVVTRACSTAVAITSSRITGCSTWSTSVRRSRTSSHRLSPPGTPAEGRRDPHSPGEEGVWVRGPQSLPSSAFHAFQNGAEGLLFTLIRTTFETALLW